MDSSVRCLRSGLPAVDPGHVDAERLAQIEGRVAVLASFINALHVGGQLTQDLIDLLWPLRFTVEEPA